MALNTYAGLKTSIANWLNRTDLTSEIADDFIKLTEADFNSKLRIKQMEQIDTITIDSETETVPTGFIAVRSFYILSSSVKYPLEYIRVVSTIAAYIQIAVSPTAAATTAYIPADDVEYIKVSEGEKIAVLRVGGSDGKVSVTELTQ